MARTIQFEGRTIQVPDDATDDEIAGIIESTPAPSGDPLTASYAPPPPAPATPPERTFGQKAAGYVATAGQELRRGMANLAGLPVDAVNNAPRLLNVLPGDQNFGPISQKPFLGSQFIFDATGGFGLVPEYTPQTAGERITGRVANEIGAASVPVGAALNAGRAGIQATRQAVANASNPLSRFFAQNAEAAAVNPVGVARREAALATAAGTGAGVANEAARNPQTGEGNMWSDFFGSLAGVLGYQTAGGIGSFGKGVVNAAAGRPVFRNEVARETVASNIIANSADAQRQFAENGGINNVDTTGLVNKLRTPSQAEVEIPGYRANIADRAEDPGLTSYVMNVEPSAPGYAAARREGNAAAVNERFNQFDPNGDPAQFRAALEADREAQLARSAANTQQAQQQFDTAIDALQPTMPDATARGSSFRTALQEADDAARKAASEPFDQLARTDTSVPAQPLADQFGAITSGKSLAEKRTIVPSETAIPDELVPQGQVPLKEVTGLRTALSNTARKADAAGGRAESNAANEYIAAIDDYLSQNIPPELRQQYEQARKAWFDYNNEFRQSGTAVGDILRSGERGNYALNDAAVTPRVTPTDQGDLTGFRSVLAKVGSDPRARNALADEIVVQARDRVQRPEALAKFMQERSIVLSEFPELRTKLEQAGVAKSVLDGAVRAEKDTTRRLTTPGQSPQASYLKFGNEATADAMRTVTASPKPREAARELIAAAGDSPEARQNARAALWEVVKTQKFQAPTPGGADRVSGSKLKAMFDDPKTAAVAEELWADKPEELAALKRFADALSRAEGSSRARVPGTSGTAQALLSRGFDARSVSSSIRSVNQGRSSIVGEFLYQAQGMLRNRSARMQSGAIADLENQVVNNPQMAADLLEEFNPANWAAKKRVLLQKYGVRATQIINIIDEGQDPEKDAKDAIMRGKEQ